MIEEIKSNLNQAGQSHLLAFWDELAPDQQSSLLKQIQEIDFSLISELFQAQDHGQQWSELAARAEVPTAITLEDFANPDSYRQAVEAGSRAIADGQVAMILVAGGQGSRLGFDHPKGMFPIGPISERTLYQIHFEHVQARAKQFGAKIPLYVMTSPPTHQETTQFIESNDRFGIAEEDLKIFCQGTMPAVDQNGKLLLADKGEIFVSPDGHGGTLAALDKSGALVDMQERGIKHVFYGQVDNPLVQICQPALIGYHILAKSEMTSQVVRKIDPLQKVGNVVVVDGKTMIIEYSDLLDQYAQQTQSDGSLKIWAGSIAVHVFETDFLVRCSADSDTLPFHRAHKKVPFVDAAGNHVKPDVPNAIKFERFIFDLLPTAKNAIVCEVDPADGFCAVKNAPPADSETPEHVKQAIIDLHTRWLIEAGAEVTPGTPVEINPLYAVDAEQLSQKLPAGTKVSQATYFEA